VAEPIGAVGSAGVAVPPALLEATGVEVVYSTGSTDLVAVKDFALSIAEREFVGLVGESGSGKSSAALAMVGLVRQPGRITRGTVRYKGQSLLDASDDQLRRIRGREIGLVVQNARAALNPMVKIGDQIANVYAAHHRTGGREARAKAVEALAAVGIPDPRRRADAYPHQLSGGMAQRVLIAMATINEPRLLIADEPTTGLDVTVQAQFLDTLRSTVRTSGSAVLFVTHDLGIVAQYCDRVAVMYQGEVIEQTTVADLFARPQHEYTRHLIESSADRKGSFTRPSGAAEAPVLPAEPAEAPAPVQLPVAAEPAEISAQ
jgi:ABC-type dipeptide/oligopeptide/nickel transport system ATPase component